MPVTLQDLPMRRILWTLVASALGLLGVLVAPQTALGMGFVGIAPEPAFDHTAPAPPVMVSPTDGSTTTNGNVPITGTAEPGSLVVVVVDGQEAGSAFAEEDGNVGFVPRQPLVEGERAVVAIALDEAGNASQPSAPVRVTIAARATDTGLQRLGGGRVVAAAIPDTGGPPLGLRALAALCLTAVAGTLLVAQRRRQQSS